MTKPAGRILSEISDGVCRITIDNAAKANSLTRSMLESLREAWRAADEDPGVLAIVLVAEGDRHFCGGADVNLFHSEEGLGDPTGALMAMTSRQNGVATPVVVAVTGLAVGGALGIVADCDVVIASRNATFTDPHVPNGQICGYGAWRLAERIPLSEVILLTLADRPLDAARAYQLGFVAELCDTPDEARTAADDVARRIAGFSPTAVQGNLALMRKLVGGQQFDDAIAAAQASMRASWEDQETAAALRQWSTSQS